MLNATWLYEFQLPTIKHTLNDRTSFDCPSWENRVKRPDAQSLDLYESDQFTLAFSTATGIIALAAIGCIATQFKVVGTLSDSRDGEHSIGIARFITTNRDMLKILFP